MAPNEVVIVCSDSETETENENAELPCDNPSCEFHYPPPDIDIEIIMEVQCSTLKEDIEFTPDEDGFLRFGINEFATDFNAILNCSWYKFQAMRTAESLFKRAIALNLICMRQEH